jgi:hypothetical protein
MHTMRHFVSSICTATRARRRDRVQCIWAEVCYDRGNYRTDMPHRAVKVGRSAHDVNCTPVVACVHARGCTAFLTCVRDATSCAQVGDKLSWRLADGRVEFSVNDEAVGTIFDGLDAATVYAGFFVGVGVVLRAEYTCWGR